MLDFTYHTCVCNVVRTTNAVPLCLRWVDRESKGGEQESIRGTDQSADAERKMRGWNLFQRTAYTAIKWPYVPILHHTQAETNASLLAQHRAQKFEFAKEEETS